MVVEQLGYLNKEKVDRLLKYKIRFGIFQTKNTQILVVNNYIASYNSIQLYYPKKDRLPWKIVEGKKITRGVRIFDSKGNRQLYMSGWNNGNQIMAYQEYSNMDSDFEPYRDSDIALKIAFPNSEHHLSDYRIDLGYFRASNGTQYQLGVTDNKWVAEHGYRCDFTIHGNEGGDYTSGRMNLLPIHRYGSKHYVHGEWKTELYRRAVTEGLIDVNSVRATYIDGTGIGHDEPLAGYPTLNKILKFE